MPQLFKLTHERHMVSDTANKQASQRKEKNKKKEFTVPQMLRKVIIDCIGGLHFLAESVRIPSLLYMAFQRMA
jgi:lipopolysaccharide/colanic/teichoic acid biosynthesis glycosyltransferase